MSRQKKKPRFRRGFKKWSDDKSIEIRRLLSQTAISPLCAFDVCNYYKIPLLTPNDIGGLDSEHLQNLLVEGKQLWSAATVPLDDDEYLIIHNPTHSSSRQQSNLMHELAHILCGHKVDANKENIGLSGFLRDYDEEQENEAEWLGACLQLPRPALIWALKNRMNENQISSHFNASLEMTRYRINVTGVRKQLWHQRRY